VLSAHTYIFSHRHATPGKNIHSGITFGQALLRGVVAQQGAGRQGIISRVRLTAQQ
jgi:hypothetical protein